MYYSISIPKIQKENSFNAIRIICCLIVIYEHIIVLSEITPPLHYILNIRNIAVDVFFIFSGFWVTKSFLASKNVKEFYIKRVKKIFPQYIAVVFIVAVIFSCFSTLSPLKYFSNTRLYKYLVCNILTLNFLAPSLPEVFSNKAVNGSLWTIKIEVGFYIVLPFIIWLYNKAYSKNYKSKYLNGKIVGNIILTIIYILSVISIPILNLISEKFNLPSEISNQLPAFISYFICGMAFFLNWDLLYKNLNKIILPALVVFALHFILKTSFLLPASLSIVVMWLSLNLKALNNIGKTTDYSYSMYLVHYPVIMVFNYYELFNKCFILSIICVFAISFMCAYFLMCVQKKIK